MSPGDTNIPKKPESLLCRLSRYPTAPDRRPLENFCTEALAWAINAWQDFGCAIAGLLIGQPPESVRGVEAVTQHSIPRGFIDLLLRVNPTEGDPYEVFVEVKVDADIGLRSGPGDSVPEEVQSEEKLHDQVDNYLSFASEKPIRVVLLSRDPVDERDQWTRHKEWLPARRWHEVLAVLHELEPQTAIDAFMLSELKALMLEYDMAFEPVTSLLTKGTPDLVRLGKIFEEAASLVKKEYELTVSSVRADRWTLHLWFTSSKGIKIGGPAYSFGEADTAFWFDQSFYGQSGVLHKLQTTLNTFEWPKSRRWWGGAYTSLVTLESEFFAASADEQVQRIADRMDDIVKAVLPIADDLAD